MTAYMISAVVAAVVMAMGAGVFYGGYRVGVAQAVQVSVDRVLDDEMDHGPMVGVVAPEDEAERTPPYIPVRDEPAVGESTGRHALREDFPTETLPAVRSPWSEPPAWPGEDVELSDEDRRWIEQDSRYERAVDAASGMEDQ